MNHKARLYLNYSYSLKLLGLLLLSACVLSLGACGRANVKVYNTDKTVVYGDNLYNVSNIKVFSPSTEAVISATKSTSLKGVDKKQFNEMLKQHKSILVRQVIKLDDQELVYQARQVDSWSKFDKMNKQFSSATSSLQKFLADKKQTQLKLK